VAHESALDLGRGNEKSTIPEDQAQKEVSKLPSTSVLNLDCVYLLCRSSIFHSHCLDADFAYCNSEIAAALVFVFEQQLMQLCVLSG
jgi:hypothetical protein